jgi:hypothetical protein
MKVRTECICKTMKLRSECFCKFVKGRKLKHPTKKMRKNEYLQSWFLQTMEDEEKWKRNETQMKKKWKRKDF